MEGMPLDDARSLSRLKALDSLSTLVVQLQEAQKLCNHSARAEMLLRWLVTKLKTTSETRMHTGAWHLLASCLRLLPVQRIAATLGGGSVPEILHKTCAEQSLPKETLFAVLRAWELLHELSQAPTGVAITALLRVDGAVAAEICGNWFQHVYRVLQLENSTSYYSDDSLSLLKFGLQLWAARKRSSEADDAAFSSEAVLGACQLVVLLGENDGLGQPKRKRFTHALATTKDYLRALESLIAKHTVLPARTTFVAAQQKATGRKQPSKAEQAAGVFDALKTSTQDVYEVVPVFLDIALRAVSMPTPGQRSRELPWVETMFDALYQLLAADRPHRREETTAAMLRCLSNHRVTLPAQKLSSLAKYALTAAGTTQGVIWQTISHIVLLNPGIFTDPVIVDELFAAIGTRQLAEEDSAFVRNHVIAPIFDAFVQKQQMRELLDLWHLQLLSQGDDEPDKIWFSIVPDVVDAISSLRRNDVAISALTQCSALLRKLALPQKQRSVQDDFQRELRADLVVLRAVLQGLRNNSQAQQNLDGLRDALMSLDPSVIPADCRQHLWQFSTVLFELWLPAWVTMQADQIEVKSFLTRLMESDLLATVIKDAETTSPATPAAQVLLASICNMVQPYDTSNERKTLRIKIVELLCAQPRSGLSVLAEYPRLLDGVSTTSVDRIFRAALSDPAHDGSPVVSSSGSRVLEILLSGVQRSAGNDDWLGELDVRNSALLAPATLSASQRGILLNKLLEQVSVHPSSGSLEQHLALILGLLTHPIKGAQLLELAPKLFNLAMVSQAPHPTSISETYRYLQVLPSIVREVCRRLSKNTDHGMPLELSQAAIEHMKPLLNGTGGIANTRASDALIMLICTTIECLEESGNIRNEACAHHDKDVLRKWVDYLIAELEATQDSLTKGQRVIRQTQYSAAANGLLVLPKTVWDLVGSKNKRLTCRIVKAAKDILRPGIEISDTLAATTFKLLCRYDTTSDLTETATRILSRAMSAKVARSVFFCFTESLGIQAKGDINADTIGNIITSQTPDTRAAAQLHGFMIKSFWANSAQTPTTYSTNDVWHFLLRTLSERQDHAVRSEVLKLIETLFTQRKHVVNQYSLEQTLTVMHQVMTQRNQTTEVFSGVCQVFRVILNQSRTQLQGRFHLVTALFQVLLTDLLEDSAAPMQIRERHARSVAQLLEIFCKPVWVRSTTTNLIDSSREAQKYTGQFVQYILHHYCSQILALNPAEAVRVAIRPGIFAICEALEAHEEARVRSLSAAMNANERAILRIVVNDWRAFGKWEGK